MKAAIFDVDGTLLDSMSVWEDIGERYLASQEYHSGEKSPGCSAHYESGAGSRLDERKNISWISLFHRLQKRF